MRRLESPATELACYVLLMFGVEEFGEGVSLGKKDSKGSNEDCEDQRECIVHSIIPNTRRLKSFPKALGVVGRHTKPEILLVNLIRRDDKAIAWQQSDSPIPCS